MKPIDLHTLQIIYLKKIYIENDQLKVMNFYVFEALCNLSINQKKTIVV